MSGVPEDPNAAFASKSDGRMYPPHLRFRVEKTSRIEAYRQKGHLTTIAINGAIRINIEPRAASSSICLAVIARRYLKFWRSAMNDIEVLRKHLLKRHPAASLKLTKPTEQNGVWWLDLTLDGRQINIEWSEETGFGITSDPSDSYGERPDESYGSLQSAILRIDALLTGEVKTSPPLSVWLARLREERRITQSELAHRMGVRQASISGFERRDDIQVSTLRRIVEALGGRLQIFAVFTEGRFALEGEHAFPEGDNTAAESSPICTKQLVGFLRASSEWKLDTGGCLEKAVDWAGRIKTTHSLLEIP